MGVALPVAPGDGNLERLTGAGGAAGKLKKVEGDGRIVIERLHGEGDVIREGLGVGIMEIGSETLDEFVETLGETLGAGIESLEG